MLKTLYVFPGQGSQQVGMGQTFLQAFPELKAVYAEADDALELSLSDLIFKGTEEVLQLTEHAQPAILVTSMVALRALEALSGRQITQVAAGYAGHSLGEYSALTAAGALNLAQAVSLVRLRGRAMQGAVPVGVGAMAAIVGLSIDAVEEICAQAQGCAPANDNAPGQVVVSGEQQAVTRAVALAKEKGARRAIFLNVSAPFHCEMMAPAQQVMQPHIAQAQMHAPAQPIWQNVDAKPHQAIDALKENLVAQLSSRVRWRETIINAQQSGIERCVELGHGSVLTGLIKRIAPSVECFAINSPQTLEAYLQHATA